jgi:hypothetical protein
MTFNYDYVETDEQVNNLLRMIEEADKLEIYTENSLEVLKTVLDCKKRRAIRKTSGTLRVSNIQTLEQVLSPPIWNAVLTVSLPYITMLFLQH